MRKKRTIHFPSVIPPSTSPSPPPMTIWRTKTPPQTSPNPRLPLLVPRRGNPSGPFVQSRRRKSSSLRSTTRRWWSCRRGLRGSVWERRWMRMRRERKMMIWSPFSRSRNPRGTSSFFPFPLVRTNVRFDVGNLESTRSRTWKISIRSQMPMPQWSSRSQPAAGASSLLPRVSVPSIDDDSSLSLSCIPSIHPHPVYDICSVTNDAISRSPVNPIHFVSHPRR